MLMVGCEYSFWICSSLESGMRISRFLMSFFSTTWMVIGSSVSLDNDNDGTLVVGVVVVVDLKFWLGL